MSKDSRKQGPKPFVPTKDLAKTSAKGRIELTEQELEGISGGPTAVEMKYQPID